MGERIRNGLTGKQIFIVSAIILGFSVGTFALETLIPRSQPPTKDAEFPSIIAVDHPQSAELRKALPINITYRFGNSAANLHVYEKFHPLSRRLELILWRPSGSYFCVWELGYILYNVSFPSTGLWIIEINLDYLGPISNLTVIS